VSPEEASIVRRSDLPEQLRLKLERLELQVQSAPAAMAVWTTLFNAAERSQLGDDPYAAWKHSGGTAGMWTIVRGVPRDQAIVEIAYALDRLDAATADELLPALGVDRAPASIPRWLKEKGELWFDGRIVRRIRNVARAKKVVAVLDAFESDGWPVRIDDPVTAGGDSSRRRRTIESLNKELEAIRFSCGGDGRSFEWKTLQRSPRRRSSRRAVTPAARAAGGKVADVCMSRGCSSQSRKA
jgi:hypothetical protein